MTPAAANTRLAVERFDFITRVGVYNRRKIGGTSSWSQHSWANALDMHMVTIEEGDQLYAWLNARRTELGIRVLLWRVNRHWNVPPPARHVHADFWPKGIGTPPLTQRGIGTFRYSDGRVVKAKIRKVPAQGEGVEQMSTLKRGDSGAAVSYYQTALNGWRSGLTVDGAFGPATESEVRDYQGAAELENTGVIGGVESFLIGRYHPDFKAGTHELGEAEVKALIEASRIVT